jgi:cytochrome c553
MIDKVTRIETFYIKTLSFLFAIIFTLSACSLLSRNKPVSEGTSVVEGDVKNGESIYFTSISNRDDQITYTDGPNFGGMMMGAYLTCASCHGPEGRGGVHQMHMQTMDAPDIRYPALNSMPDLQGKNRSYSLDDFKTEVEGGNDLNGEPLDSLMPRWKMSQADLQDLFAFIQSLH